MAVHLFQDHCLGRILTVNVFVVKKLIFWRKPIRRIVFIDVLGSFSALGVLIANRQMSGLVFI